MYTKTAIEFFGSRAEIARKLKSKRTRSAVYQWPENGLVPLLAAYELEALADSDKLKVNRKLYERKMARHRAALSKAAASA